MHFAQAAVLLASDHTATPSSEATDGIASPQHRRCASSRRRPSRSGRGGRVGSLPVRVWWNGLGAVPSGPPQLRMRRRKATALPTGRDRERRRRRDAGRACRPPETGIMVCALPLFLPIPVGNAAQECSPPLETSIRRSFASTDDSSRRGIVYGDSSQSATSTSPVCASHSPVCFRTSPVCSRPFSSLFFTPLQSALAHSRMRSWSDKAARDVRPMPLRTHI